METVTKGQPYSVFIDYAHTPDAFENIFSSIQEIKKNKIITVFGCGGDRDTSKRPLMGRSASTTMLLLQTIILVTKIRVLLLTILKRV